MADWQKDFDKKFTNNIKEATTWEELKQFITKVRQEAKREVLEEVEAVLDGVDDQIEGDVWVNIQDLLKEIKSKHLKDRKKGG